MPPGPPGGTLHKTYVRTKLTERMTHGREQPPHVRQEGRAGRQWRPAAPGPGGQGPDPARRDAQGPRQAASRRGQGPARAGRPPAAAQGRRQVHVRAGRRP
ncbi:hypothetical protein SGPA1_50600 [Streptomyces misionensis JCM 4497]